MKSYLTRGVRALFHNQLDYVSTMGNYSQLTKVALGAVLAALAAIFQSAGLFIGFGYVLSMLATWPLIMATMISTRIGLMAYISTIFLLAIIQPSELLVFSFTTGLLGVSIGFGIRKFNKVLLIMMFASTALLLGIIILISVFQFPILGPSIKTLGFGIIGGMFLFSLLYSWIWIRVSLLVIKAIQKSLLDRKASVYDQEG